MRFRSSVAMAMSPPVVLSLRAISGECCVKASSGDGFVRFVYLDLVCSGSRVQIPFLGSLFSVDWDLLLRRQASDPFRRVEATAVGSSPEHSTFQVHAIFGVSLVAIQNREVSSSAWVSASSFFLGALLFHSVARQSAKQRRFQPAATKTILWTSIECQCNFRFFRSLGFRGLDVKNLYQ